MAVIASDGLHLLVGDGAVSESFEVFQGIELKRFDLAQTLAQSVAVDTDGWAEGVATGARQMLLECQAVATSSSPAERIRNLALLGAAGNFKLMVSATQEIHFAAFVLQYREMTQAGAMKRVQFRLESSGVILSV